MDYYTTAEIAQCLEARGKEIRDTDPEFSAQLLTASYFLRIYATLECTYRARLGCEFESAVDQVNKLFKNDHTG